MLTPRLCNSRRVHFGRGERNPKKRRSGGFPAESEGLRVRRAGEANGGVALSRGSFQSERPGGRSPGGGIIEGRWVHPVIGQVQVALLNPAAVNRNAGNKLGK